jgi:hypothetical protein
MAGTASIAVVRAIYVEFAGVSSIAVGGYIIVGCAWVRAMLYVSHSNSISTYI